ncbi:MAG: MFS transporter [Chloroflexota bacterium]|nr:MFS transporter [Chloroflexota bacterium]
MRSSWILNSHFAALWFGQSISQLGDAVIEVTLPIWAAILTNDPTQVALVAATEVVPAFCLGPFTGALVDRWNSRTTMIVCDLLRAGLIGSLLFVPPAILSWYLYVASFSIALVGSFFSPAKSVTLRLVIEEEEIVRAQALSRATQSITLILGPVLGSALLFFFGPKVGLLLDAFSFGIGATALLWLRLVHHPIRPSCPSPDYGWRTLWVEMGNGLRFVMRDRTLVVLIATSSITALVGHLWYSVDVFFVQSSLKAPKESVGLLWTISGAGGLVGSLLVLLRGKKHRPEVVLLTGLFFRGTSLIWYATMTSYAWAVPAAFLAGLGDDFVIVALGSLVMERTKPGMLGRVTAFFDTASALTTLLALVTVRLLQTWLSPGSLLLFCGLAVCMVGMSTALGLRGARLPHP